MGEGIQEAILARCQIGLGVSWDTPESLSSPVACCL